MIREAKALGLPLTVETCFHYLCLAAEDIPDGRPEFKCCPPVREAPNRQLLWDALKDGTIDCVVSDHSPCVLELKHMDDGDIMAAWGGISTLGLGLSLLWTEGQKRGIPIAQIVDWISRKTAEHAGLGNLKGQIEAGYDADFVLWDSDAEFMVRLFLLIDVSVYQDSLIIYVFRFLKIRYTTRIKYPLMKASNFAEECNKPISAERKYLIPYLTLPIASMD